jgi:hypothetical protein
VPLGSLVTNHNPLSTGMSAVPSAVTHGGTRSSFCGCEKVALVGTGEDEVGRGGKAGWGTPTAGLVKPLTSTAQPTAATTTGRPFRNHAGQERGVPGNHHHANASATAAPSSRLPAIGRNGGSSPAMTA